MGNFPKILRTWLLRMITKSKLRPRCIFLKIPHWQQFCSVMTLNYWVVVEKYQFPNRVIGGSIPTVKSSQYMTETTSWVGRNQESTHHKLGSIPRHAPKGFLSMIRSTTSKFMPNCPTLVIYLLQSTLDKCCNCICVEENCAPYKSSKEYTSKHLLFIVQKIYKNYVALFTAFTSISANLDERDAMKLYNLSEVIIHSSRYRHTSCVAHSTSCKHYYPSVTCKLLANNYFTMYTTFKNILGVRYARSSSGLTYRYSFELFLDNMEAEEAFVRDREARKAI